MTDKSKIPGDKPGTGASTTNEKTPSPDVTNKATTGKDETSKDVPLDETRAKIAETAGKHDYSDEANAGTGGGTTDAYSGQGQVQHPNLVSGTAAQPPLGGAPAAPAMPMGGSANAGGAADSQGKDDPSGGVNAVNKSPVLAAPDVDPRNAPDHPDHAHADKDHPDYGKPVEQHKGKPRT